MSFYRQQFTVNKPDALTGRFLPAVAVILVLASSGCARDYVSRTAGVRKLYENYEHQQAIELLDKGRDSQVKEKKTKKEVPEKTEEYNRDALLYLLDRAMILHSAGEFEESNKFFHKAEKKAAELDIISVSEEAGSLATNPSSRAYRGEEHEIILINVYKALNYAAQGEMDSALVEVRRMNERLRGMSDRELKIASKLAITWYIAGVLWEWAGEKDSAFIDYFKAHESSSNLGYLAKPILRLAEETGRSDHYEELRSVYPDLDHDPPGRDEGKVVVVISAGLAPEKKPSVPRGDIDIVSLPRYEYRRWMQVEALISVEDSDLAPVAAIPVTSVERLAMLNFEQKLGRMMGRGLAGTAVKAGIATAVGVLTKSEDMGFLTFYLFMLSNRPDLRSWLSLPGEFQVARMRLPAGEHVLELKWGSNLSRYEITVKAGEITVLPLRRY